MGLLGFSLGALGTVVPSGSVARKQNPIPPEVSDVATLLSQLAFPVDAVARKISAEVCPPGLSERAPDHPVG